MPADASGRGAQEVEKGALRGGLAAQDLPDPVDELRETRHELVDDRIACFAAIGGLKRVEFPQDLFDPTLVPRDGLARAGGLGTVGMDPDPAVDLGVGGNSPRRDRSAAP